MRDYSNSMTRSMNSGSGTVHGSGGALAPNLRKVNNAVNLNKVSPTSVGASVSNPTSAVKMPPVTAVVEEEIKEAVVEDSKAEEPRVETANEVDQQIEQMVIQHEPGKLDLAFEQALEAPKAVDNIQQRKYLIFRPYIDPMSLRPHKPSDQGYYFKFYNNVNVHLIRYTFEDNGFREVSDRNQEWSVSWACSNIKSQLYQSLSRNQKVNHFPKSTEMTRKDCMYRHLARLRETHGKYLN